MVLMNGEVIDIGGDYLDAPGYDFLGLIVGSEGQFGVVTEATVRLLKAPEGARPMLLGFDSIGSRRRLRRRHHRRRHRARRHRVHGQACDPGLREFRRRRLPARRRGAAHRRGRGLPRTRSTPCSNTIAEIAERYRPRVVRVSKSAEESASIWKGRKAAFGAIGQISDYYCMDGVIPLVEAAQRR